MAGKGNEIIRMRNEGAVAYDSLIQEHGYDDAKKILINRVGTRCNIVMKEDEWNSSVDAIKNAVVHTYLSLVYTTLHDDFGFGETRLRRFKEALDSTTSVCYATDPHGKRYMTVRDCAAEMNKLYDLGIDLDVVWDTEVSSTPLSRRMASVDEMIGFLKLNGQEKAAKLIWTECYGRDCEVNKERTKEQRRIAKQKRREDRKYIPVDMNLFDPDVSLGYLSIISFLMAQEESTPSEIMDFCYKVNMILTDILNGGKKVLNSMVRELEEEYSIVFDEEETDG